MEFALYAALAIISTIVSTLIVSRISFFDNTPRLKWVVDICLFFILYFSGLAIYDALTQNNKIEDTSKQTIYSIFNKQNLKVEATEIVSKTEYGILWKVFVTGNLYQKDAAQIYYCRSIKENKNVITNCSTDKTSL